jgi:hypothetical protein
MITTNNTATYRKRYNYQVCFPSTKVVIHTDRTLKGARAWASNNFAGSGVTYFISKVAA